MENLIRLLVITSKMSPVKLRLLLHFAEFLAKGKGG